VKSPCVKICKLAPGADYCIGCFRTLTEIKEWSKMNNNEKSGVLMELNNRECRHLLEQVVNWFHSEMGNGNLKHLIQDIEVFLEKTNEKKEKT
jgi:predicted Fe-S protein YdhL (DUF1289 family)